MLHAACCYRHRWRCWRRRCNTAAACCRWSAGWRPAACSCAAACADPRASRAYNPCCAALSPLPAAARSPTGRPARASACLSWISTTPAPPPTASGCSCRRPSRRRWRRWVGARDRGTAGACAGTCVVAIASAYAGPPSPSAPRAPRTSSAGGRQLLAAGTPRGAAGAAAVAGAELRRAAQRPAGGNPARGGCWLQRPPVPRHPSTYPLLRGLNRALLEHGMLTCLLAVAWPAGRPSLPLCSPPSHRALHPCPPPSKLHESCPLRRPAVSTRGLHCSTVCARWLLATLSVSLTVPAGGLHRQAGGGGVLIDSLTGWLAD